MKWEKTVQSDYMIILDYFSWLIIIVSGLDRRGWRKCASSEISTYYHYGGLAMKEYIFAMLAGCVLALMTTLTMAEMIS